ncbi:RHS repeat-associated core domain-containing protein [Parvularcula sp. LCG005]|uniref:RHS repeat-associated core domain-containing protein n=1 Tax=Parvularcula sp. LCG005 TaxID=3078805 RepID=UPI003978E593
MAARLTRRFLQADPIGYGDGLNMYAYVGGDPVNRRDPSGLQQECWDVYYSYNNSNTTGSWSTSGGSGSGSRRDCADVPDEGPKFQHMTPGVFYTPTPQHRWSPREECKSPPISDQEQVASDNGDRQPFYSSRFDRNDPMARVAMQIVNNEGIRGKVANFSLASHLLRRDILHPAMSRNISYTDEIEQISVELMRAHVDAVKEFGNPSAGQIARYHYRVFDAHGLPHFAFGGSPYSGTSFEAFLTQKIWLGCK